MHGATRTDIGFICTAVLPSSVWGARSAAWGVKPENEVDNTLNRTGLTEDERVAQTAYRTRVNDPMDQLATDMAPRVMDWQAITEIVQDIKESPSAYKARLYEQIELHSGYEDQRRPWNRNNGLQRVGECYTCGQPGHWSRERHNAHRQRNWDQQVPPHQERPTAPPGGETSQENG